MGDLLIRSAETIEPTVDCEYREITVRLWGKGVVERGRVLGADLSGRRFVARAGQFIASRIDARNGATGLVPTTLDGALVTNDFPLFHVRADRLSPSYLGWLCRTASFVELCLRASEGTTNRVRLKVEAFLGLDLALPPLPEQQRLVRDVDAVQTALEIALARRRDAEVETSALRLSVLNARLGVEPRADWLPLSSFVFDLEAGSSPQCETRPASDSEWGVLKVGAISFGTFDAQENKALPQGMPVDLRDEVCEGDLLISRANTPELVGACCVVGKVRPRLLLSDKTLRFRFLADTPLSAVWLNWVLKSPVLRSQIGQSASGTSPTMKNLSKDRILALLIPPHNAADQLRLVSDVSAIDEQVERLRRLQARARAELDALIPAVLNRAFAGAL